ncbi:MAG: hypothetical protein ACOX4C_03470 [Bacillota bacterium]|jgi:Tfp pilus assembly protein PilV|nr:hypothetical protein [Bacillota bacterium]NLH87999.1 hypothetical protein [Bacillota bacterium]
MEIRHSESGLSFVEVLIAVVLVGVVIVTLLYSIAEAINVQKSAELASAASNLALESIELYRSFFNTHEYDKLVSRTSEDIQYGAFSRSVDVTPSGTEPNRTWTISVTVTYQAGGSSRSVTHQTLFAER